MARGNVLWRPVLITSFSFCVLFLPQVEFSRRKTGRPSGKQTSLRNILTPWKDPERGGKGKRAATSPTTCVFYPFPPICPPHQPTLLGTWDLWPKDRHHITAKITTLPAQTHPISLIQHFLFGIHSGFFSTTPLPKWSWVGGMWILSWCLLF